MKSIKEVATIENARAYAKSEDKTMFIVELLELYTVSSTQADIAMIELEDRFDELLMDEAKFQTEIPDAYLSYESEDTDECSLIFKGSPLTKVTTPEQCYATAAKFDLQLTKKWIGSEGRFAQLERVML